MSTTDQQTQASKTLGKLLNKAKVIKLTKISKKNLFRHQLPTLKIEVCGLNAAFVLEIDVLLEKERLFSSQLKYTSQLSLLYVRLQAIANAN